MIEYCLTAHSVSEEDLESFFVGRPQRPDLSTHLKLLRHSDYVVVAKDSRTGHVVGFVTAISDPVMSAYLPLLEVLPEYRGQRTAAELIRRMLTQLDGLYMIDALCDDELGPFYERFGFVCVAGMARRDYRAQRGRGMPELMPRLERKSGARPKIRRPALSSVCHPGPRASRHAIRDTLAGEYLRQTGTAPDT
jgi:predicted N-acetyltransferase YhbS